MEKQNGYPYNLPLDEEYCHICGAKTEFTEDWTIEDVVEDYELQMINAKLNHQKTVDDPETGTAGVACGNCYNMLYHFITPSKIFLKGMLKLGFINKKYYKELKKKHGL